ncbi:MAG: hypothetical protein H6838_11705 [Planctomycetes bacterium]|nr:hypothetical protein [Planctomycetota bacterium]MCB9886151.1 hypothetical protein [Planctomycetota bacterium]
MTVTMKNQLLCLALISFAACGGDAPVTKPAAGGGAAPMADDHGEAHPLGKITLNDMQVEVALLGDLSGGVANIDLEFPAGTKLPSVVRGWVGLESAVGSRKAQLHKESSTGMHGHLDLPKTVPDGSKIWIEIEAGGKTSAAGIDYR